MNAVQYLGSVENNSPESCIDRTVTCSIAVTWSFEDGFGVEDGRTDAAQLLENHQTGDQHDRLHVRRLEEVGDVNGRRFILHLSVYQLFQFGVSVVEFASVILENMLGTCSAIWYLYNQQLLVDINLIYYLKNFKRPNNLFLGRNSAVRGRTCKMPQVSPWKRPVLFQKQPVIEKTSAKPNKELGWLSKYRHKSSPGRGNPVFRVLKVSIFHLKQNVHRHKCITLNAHFNLLV